MATDINYVRSLRFVPSRRFTAGTYLEWSSQRSSKSRSIMSEGLWPPHVLLYHKIQLQHVPVSVTHLTKRTAVWGRKYKSDRTKTSKNNCIQSFSLSNVVQSIKLQQKPILRTSNGKEICWSILSRRFHCSLPLYETVCKDGAASEGDLSNVRTLRAIRAKIYVSIYDWQDSLVTNNGLQHLFHEGACSYRTSANRRRNCKNNVETCRNPSSRGM